MSNNKFNKTGKLDDKLTVPSNPVYNAKAYSIVKLEDGTFNLIEIDFNKETLETSDGVVISTHDHHLDAEERFQVKVYHEVFE